MSSEQLHDYLRTAGAVFADASTPQHFGSPEAEYQAVLERTALADASGAGRLWLGDRDRAALLHRLSTNDIEQLQPGQGTRTVLTNHNGRIIDLLTVHALPERLLLVTSAGQAGPVSKLLRKNIFFGDKVTIADASAELGQLALYGPGSAALLGTLLGQDVDALAPFAVRAATLDGLALWVARGLPLGGAGFRLYVPAEALPQAWAALHAAGAQPLGQAAYDILRVEAGYGVFGRELSLEYIPLETRLRDAVSFTKGCYVGQEIISRMDSRGRIAKELRGLRLSAPLEVPPGTPRALLAEGKYAGDLTSTVVSPRFGPLGLAYVRQAHLEPGTQLGLAESDVTGEVVPLPL